MWRFMDSTWTYDPSISKLVTALAVLAVAGIPVLIYAKKTRRRLLKTLWLISVFLVVVILVCSFAVDGYHWMDKWEGRIVSAYSEEGWSLRTGARKTSYFLRIDLHGVGPAMTVTVSLSTYLQVRIGDYLVKKQGKYLPEIQRQ
ncbi:hypothetical protein ACFL6S_24900 [Candidatus Poribacteria bacterium]